MFFYRELMARERFIGYDDATNNRTFYACIVVFLTNLMKYTRCL